MNSYTLEEYVKLGRLYFASEGDREIAMQQLQFNDTIAFTEHIFRGLVSAMECAFREKMQDLLFTANIKEAKETVEQFTAFGNLFRAGKKAIPLISLKYNYNLIKSSLERATDAVVLVEKLRVSDLNFTFGEMPSGADFVKTCLVTHWSLDRNLEVTIGVEIDGETIEIAELPSSSYFTLTPRRIKNMKKN